VHVRALVELKQKRRRRHVGYRGLKGPGAWEMHFPPPVHFSPFPTETNLEDAKSLAGIRNSENGKLVSIIYMGEMARNPVPGTLLPEPWYTALHHSPHTVRTHETRPPGPGTLFLRPEPCLAPRNLP
jgi:hypothetical protein